MSSSFTPKRVWNSLRYRLQRRPRPVGAGPDEVERAEWKFYLDRLRSGMIAFDVGAYRGEVTLLFARLVGPEGRVHTFEASKENHARLGKIIALSGRANIELTHAAVRDREGVAQLRVYDDEHLGWNSLADRPLEKYGINVRAHHVEEVPAVTIDSYCKSKGVERIDVLKIDVEGAELQVLLGARALLQSRRIACAIFEFGQTTFDMGNRPEQITDYMESVGYRLRNVVRGDPLFPGGEKVETARFAMLAAEPKL